MMDSGMTLSQALAEAARCLLCHDAPCAAGCPADTGPDVFIRKLRFRNLKGAAKSIKERNILGAACGVVCPTESLCAAGCSAAGLGEPIKIGALQRFLVEHAWELGYQPLEAGSPNGKRVAIVGGGPAGISCAAELARGGYEVVIFERRQAAGGMLRFGIPNHRMSRAFIERELEDLWSLGVELRADTRVETQADLDQLRAEGFDAVFVATGALKSASLDVPHREGEGVVDALTFLQRAKDDDGGLGGELSGKDVVVVGGGDTALDAAVTAKRAGARDVYLVYRRSFGEMPGGQTDTQLALEVGVHFLILTQPVDYLMEQGRLHGVRVVRTRLGDPDESGRRRPENLPSTEHTLAADLVIEAIGLAPEPAVRQLGYVSVDGANRIQVGEDQRASSKLPLYAGGDAVRGPALVVKAVADGKAAAAAIRKELGQ